MNNYDRNIENCRTLDNIGYSFLNSLNIPVFVCDMSQTARTQCDKARKYYRNRGIRVSKYEMHHTIDGTIVPIVTQLHKGLHHVGGVALFGIER